MSKITVALEAAVADIIANTPESNVARTARQRANIDKAFVSILRLIAPRIRHFIRQYGLIAHKEDAEQCCAIAVHRAIQTYDPTKAQFTTFVNWQIRGELQSLRFRVMADQRPSAKKVGATTVSLQASIAGSDGQEVNLESIIEDENALARTEAGASDYLANSATSALVRQFMTNLRSAGIEQILKRPRAKRVPLTDACQLPLSAQSPLQRHSSRLRGIDPAEIEKLEQKFARDKEIVERRVFDQATLDELGFETGVTKERVRQITKRASRVLGEIARTDPKFAVMAEYRKPKALPAILSKKIAKAHEEIMLLPEPNLPHNQLSRVVTIAPQAPHLEIAKGLAFEAQDPAEQATGTALHMGALNPSDQAGSKRPH